MAAPSTTYDTATLVNPASALTDFTLMVDLSRLSAAWWAAVGSETDGTKGRAYKSDGTTELAVDWIDFDSTADSGWARIKWSGTLATSGTQTVHIYPPVTANASAAPGGTYGAYNAYDSNWVDYWPLGDALPAANRISGSGTLADTGGVSDSTGQVGGAKSFDGVNDQLTGTSTSVGTTNTVLGWFRPVGNTGNTAPVYANGGCEILARSSTWQVYGSSFVGATSLINDTWQHVAVSRNDTATNEYIINFNGSAVTTTTRAFADGTSTARTLSATVGGAVVYTGHMNEVQVHSTNRAAAWIAKEYLQTSDNATMWGSWANVAAPASGGSSRQSRDRSRTR